MIRVSCGLMLAVVVIAATVRATPAQTPAIGQAAPPPPPAAWRNVQVLTELKTAPAQRLYDTMDFIAGSLSVSCDYCHAGPYDVDIKPAKTRAREMIRMVRAINDTNFAGQMVVTCETCHHGHPKPSAMPRPWYKTPDEIVAYRHSIAPPPDAAPGVNGLAEPATRAPSTPLPSAETVLAKYRTAVGASSLKSLRLTGAVASDTFSGGIEFLAVFPDRLQITRTINGVATRQSVNRDHGWLTAPDVRIAMTASDIAHIAQDLAPKLLLPVSLMPSTTLTVAGLEAIDGHPCYVVAMSTPFGLERWFFDADSWLLVKTRRETPTALGTAVRESEFRDYRDGGGVKRAFKVLDHFMAAQSETTFTSIDTDVAVDPATFEPPAPVERPSITLAPAVLDAVAGRYQLAPGTVLTFTREGTQLFMTQANGVKTEVLAASPTEFFLKGLGVSFAFVKDSSGDVTSVTLKQGPVTRECPRIK